MNSQKYKAYIWFKECFSLLLHLSKIFLKYLAFLNPKYTRHQRFIENAFQYGITYYTLLQTKDYVLHSIFKCTLKAISYVMLC